MPKFPGLSGKEIVRALEKLGFHVARQSGSHILMKRDEKGCVVPNHKEVKVGTVNGILRQAAISPQEFQQALSN
jgi:predicted RNA binding protein YcfA (HicA-like mRNA interferase family)